MRYLNRTLIAGVFASFMMLVSSAAADATGPAVSPTTQRPGYTNATAYAQSLSAGNFATPDGNGASFHLVTVTCGTAGFYANYDTHTDDFQDQTWTFHAGDSVHIRSGNERVGPRGVLGYVYQPGVGWGFMSKNCLQGYH